MKGTNMFEPITVYAVSDMTGQTVSRVVRAASAQFAPGHVRIKVLSHAVSAEQIVAFIQQSGDGQGTCAVFHTILSKQVRKDLPKVIVGDNVRVHYRIREGEREREQVFQGDVIRMSGAGARETFTVRKLSFGVGVERTFPVHSPKIAKLEVVRHGQIRRAKLYYLRDRVGKAARIREKRI